MKLEQCLFKIQRQVPPLITHCILIVIIVIIIIIIIIIYRLYTV